MRIILTLLHAGVADLRRMIYALGKNGMSSAFSVPVSGRRFFLMFVSIALYGAIFATPSFASSFELSEPQLSVGIGENLRVVGEFKGKVHRKKLRGKRLWISLTIIGGKRALDQLESSQELILRAETWSPYRKLRAYPQIGITRERWERDREGLWSEYNEKKIFTWRTNFYTDQTSYDKIYLKFWDADDQDVPLVGSDGAFQPKIDIAP